MRTINVYKYLLGLLLIISLDQCRQPSSTTPNNNSAPTRDDNMALGNSDSTRFSESSPNAYLITRSTHSLSYNNATGMANCRAAGAVQLASEQHLEGIDCPLRR